MTAKNCQSWAVETGRRHKSVQQILKSEGPDATAAGQKNFVSGPSSVAVLTPGLLALPPWKAGLVPDACPSSYPPITTAAIWTKSIFRMVMEGKIIA
jgi:hypothetical protein